MSFTDRHALAASYACLAAMGALAVYAVANAAGVGPVMSNADRVAVTALSVALFAGVVAGSVHSRRAVLTGSSTDKEQPMTTSQAPPPAPGNPFDHPDARGALAGTVHTPPPGPPPAPAPTTGSAHGALWCSILGLIIPFLGWFLLAPLGLIFGLVENRRARQAGRPVGVPIAAAVIGAVVAIPAWGILLILIGAGVAAG